MITRDLILLFFWFHMVTEIMEVEIEIMMKYSKQVDLLNMNVTWIHKDLELYDNRFGVGEATLFTTVDTIKLVMGVIAHRTFYKMMKRLPGRAVNQILYPHMVRAVNYFCCIV